VNGEDRNTSARTSHSLLFFEALNGRQSPVHGEPALGMAEVRQVEAAETLQRHPRAPYNEIVLRAPFNYPIEVFLEWRVKAFYICGKYRARSRSTGSVEISWGL
jgi:hypothetical protein